MKKLSLQTQIMLILLLSILVMMLMLYTVIFPQYERNIAQNTFRNLEYQLTLTQYDEFLNSVVLLDQEGNVVFGEVKKEDESIFNNYMLYISNEIVHAAPNTKDNQTIIIDSYVKIFYSFEKYDDSSSRVVFAMVDLQSDLFGDEQTLRLLGVVIFSMVLPVFLIILWFAKVSNSIITIKNAVANDEVAPKIASKELASLEDSIAVFKTEIKEDTEQKQKLFQNISHELKTPITTIRMYAEGIEDGIYRDGDINNNVKIIKDETDVLLDRVNKIMDINKLYHVETDAIELRKEKLILSETVFEILSLYAKRAPDVHFDADLNRAEWVGNHEIWERIIVNIFDNNIKHNAKNISIKLKKNELLIQNDGDTIEEDILEKLFVPFIKGQNGNYGLGLNIIQRSLKILGYSIEVKNTSTGVLYRIY